MEASASTRIQTSMQKPEVPREAWTADRCGRLFSGGLFFLFGLLGLVDSAPRSTIWMIASTVAGFQLVATAVVGRCPIHSLLKRWGVKDREEVYVEQMRGASKGGVSSLSKQAITEKNRV